MSLFSNWISGSQTPTSDGSGQVKKANFRPVSSTPQADLFGPLEAKDTQWTCDGGFATETQTWYTVLEDGAFATVQIIHSSVGLWYPQIQITFKYYNPITKQRVWKSVNVSKFTTPPPSSGGKTYDKRSAKADQFSILLEPGSDGSETYNISANLDSELQLSLYWTRPASVQGWKLGKGPKGGFSYFGVGEEQGGSDEGYVIHRFWPRAISSGHIIYKGAAIDAKGQGMFVHAIQGMRPNLVAASWNFANFQSDQYGGVSGIMMEFTTTDSYSNKAPSGGRTTVNVGSVVVGGRLVAVTASTKTLGSSGTGDADVAVDGSSSSVEHGMKNKDEDTGYSAPGTISYLWQGPFLSATSSIVEGENVKAELQVDVGKQFPSTESKGLVDKVDVLAEIPYVVKKVVNYVAGTKPYIYQWLNPATMTVHLPASWTDEKNEAEPTPDGAKKLTVQGVLFNEATFISQ